jgi:RNA polymerase sigma factor (sigma-70 family)
MSKNTAQAYTTWQDKEERDRILLEQLPQVRHHARRIHERLPRHVPFEDMVHAGVIGLIDALDKFDRSEHVQFGSYAEFRVRDAILDSLREMDWGPRELRRKARGVEEAQRKLSLELSRAPTEIEVAAELKLGLREFQQLLAELDGLEQKTLQQLLREQVSIRDLSAILETLLDLAPANKNPALLAEAARQALGRSPVRPLLSENGGLRVVTLDRALEEELGRAFSGQEPAVTAGLQPPFARRILDGLRRLGGDQVAVASTVLLCSTPARYHLKRLLEPFLPNVVVLSHLEVPPMVEVQSLGVLR